jgi:gluconolactonase
MPLHLACLLLFLTSSALSAADDYKLGSDSMEQPGVPKGKVTKYSWTSVVYPETNRDYWIYLPAQYDAGKPACETPSCQVKFRPRGVLIK